MIDDLRQILPVRERIRIDRPERAAVLIPIVDDGGPTRLLLTRRTNDVATHQGQVAFPGGYGVPGEEDPVRTALREAEEEVGLPPSLVEILGFLDDLPTLSGAVAVTPVVGLLRTLPPLAPQTGEVARIFTIPFDDLMTPGRWVMRMEEHRGRLWRVFYFEHDGEVLWGLSARITLNLLDLTPGGSPIPLARPG